MTSARIYDSWEEEQAATKKVAALARRPNPDDLLSELLPARSPQRANAATVMQVLSEMAAQGHGSLRWNLMTMSFAPIEGRASRPRRVSRLRNGGVNAWAKPPALARARAARCILPIPRRVSW